MTAYRHVALIGVGLLGGSVGSALRRANLARRIVGWGRNEATLAAAKGRGVCDETTTDFDEAVRGADVAVICTPVQTVAALAHGAGELIAPGGFVTDVGSVKGSIVVAVEAAGVSNFVGSHPMAGGEKGGVEFARADLFDGALTFVTPTPRTDARRLERTVEFWQSLGSRTKVVSPEEHDACVASTSHVPHLVASALAAATPPEMLDCIAGGWRDSTRIASGDVEMWRQIVEENRGPILSRLADFRDLVAALHRSLAAGDDEEWVRILEEGKRRRDAVGS